MPSPWRAGALLWLAAAAWATPATDAFDRAAASYARGDYAVAVDGFAKFLKDYPEDSQAVSAAFLRGVSQYQAGQPQAALDSFQKLERTWPTSVFRTRLPYWKGVAAAGAGLWAVADRELTAQARFPDEKPWYARSLFQLAWVKFHENQAAAGREALLRYLAVGDEGELRAQAQLRLADDARQAGDSQARAWYAQASASAPGSPYDLAARQGLVDWLLAASDGGEALALVDESAPRFPAQRDFWELRRIEAARQAGDLAASRQAVAARLEHESDPARRQKLWNNLALLSDQLGQGDADLWARAATGPDAELAAGAQRRQAALLEGQGKFAAAAALLAGRPDREDWLLRAAQDWQQADNAAQALAAWNEFVRRYPKSTSLAVALDARAGLLLAQGDTAAALRDLDRLLKEAPKYPRQAEVRYQMGLVYLQRNEPLRAEGWFYGLINELGSGDLYERALLARGQAYANAGKTDLARGSLERLLRERPLGAWAGDAWFALGRVGLQERDFRKAWTAFAQASNTLADVGRQAQALWEGLDAFSRLGEPARASELYLNFSTRFTGDARAGEAVYRSGAVFVAVQDWASAVDRWSPRVETLSGAARVETRQGLAVALLQLGRADDARAQLETLEGEKAGEGAAAAWFQFGQTATALGLGDEASSAYETLIRRHPDSPLVEKALPRAAGALLTGGNAGQALARYSDYFSRFGQQTGSAAVARAATQASAVYPDLLASLVAASRGWSLAPEVRAEFDLAWWKSQLDVDAAQALVELQRLSRQAPWSSQRSQALYVAGQWSLAQARLDDAKAYFDAAAALGDDLSVFRARLGLALVAQKDGRGEDAARQTESAEKAAGPGVPLEFRLAALQDARALWLAASRDADVARLDARLKALQP